MLETVKLTNNFTSSTFGCSVAETSRNGSTGLTEQEHLHALSASLLFAACNKWLLKVILINNCLEAIADHRNVDDRQPIKTNLECL